MIYYPNSLVQSALTAAQSVGANVVRTWAFLDAGNIRASDWNGYWLQRTYSVGLPEINYGDSGLNHLDDVIYAAQQKNMKLILVLSDNWRSFGGIDQYVSWAGMDKHDYFFSDTTIKNTFKRWISTLLNRVNHNTGILYKNDPTIFGWELINEPRCSGGGLFYSSGNCNSMTISNWVAEMSAYVRSIDSNHMIGLGDEGFFNRPSNSDWTYSGGNSEGGNFDYNLALTNINFGTFHVYPDAWGKDATTWVTQWINDHAASSVTYNKPVILEEYGWYNDNNRVNYFTTWTNAVQSSNLAGSLFWMLGVSGAPGDSYVIYQGDSALTVIQNHGNNLSSKNTCF